MDGKRNGDTWCDSVVDGWAQTHRDGLAKGFTGSHGFRVTRKGSPWPANRVRSLNPVNFGVIDALRAIEVRRPGMVKRFVESFLRQAPERLARMEESVATGDWATLERLASDMESDSGNLGARRLSALCGELRKAAREGAHPDLCVDVVPRVEAEFKEVRTAFAAAGLG